MKNMKIKEEKTRQKKFIIVNQGGKQTGQH